MIANFGRAALVVVATTILITAPTALAASAAATQPVPAPEASMLTSEPIADVCSPTVDAAAADLFDWAAGQGDQNRNGCPQGIKPCTANQVGQPCNPNRPSLICSAQANGAYCCLAYAGAADTGEIAASGGGPCCTHQDKTACAASCQAAGCGTSIAACINLRCSCRCSGCP